MEIVAAAFRIAYAGTTARPIPCCWAARTITRVALRAAVRQGVAAARPSRCCLKVPSIHATVASSKEMAAAAAGGAAQRKVAEPEQRFRRDVRRALGDLISAKTMKEIINMFHAAGHAAVRSGDPGHPISPSADGVALDTRRGLSTDPDVGKIATFAIVVRHGPDTSRLLAPRGAAMSVT